MSEFNDLLHSIRKIAHEHEEPYKEGSWEIFLKRNEKKKAILIWPYLVSGLVASLVIGFFILPKKFDHSTNDNLSNHSSKIEFSEIITGADSATTKRTDKGTKTESRQIGNGNIQKEKDVTYSVALNEKNRNQTGKVVNGAGLNPEYETEEQVFQQDGPITGFSADTLKGLTKPHNLTKYLIEDLEAELPEKKKSGRLNFGFSISPLLASNKSGSNLGISTGFQTDIPLSKAVSFNSGLTLAHQKVENIYENRASFNDPASLTSRLFSFDIPINLKITLKREKNKESYLLAGISSVGYLSERNTFTYEYEEVIEITTTSGGQEISTYQTIVNETSLENNEPAFSTFNFVGIMNLSYGFKSSFSKNAHLTFAPYIKLPLSNLTSNNLRYTIGGVSLIISK